MSQMTQTMAHLRISDFIANTTAASKVEARESFFAFRQRVRPQMQWGWWMEVLCMELQQFYEDLRLGRRPKLAVMAPPQHGKSWSATDFIAWVAGKNPDLKTIFASYSADLGQRTNLDRAATDHEPELSRRVPTYADRRAWLELQH